MKLASFTTALALLLAGAGPTTAAPRKGEAGYDPERTICKSRSVVGSRVTRVRECHSALEWDELKLQERLGLARQQINGAPGCPQPPCTMERGGKDTPW